MRIAIPREITPGERRVALSPEMVARLTKAGHAVSVQAGAGEGASFTDGAFEAAGATIVRDAGSLYRAADAVLKVQRPAWNEAVEAHEADLLEPGALLIAFLKPSADRAVLDKL